LAYCLSKLGTRFSQEIGALIYCGIDRGVAEPSHASLVAQKFGLDRVRTFDISDACMGWFTASQVASTFCTKEKPYCAIISAEFPLEMPGKLYPPAFTIRTEHDLLWNGAALTLGETASVTIIDSVPRIRNEAHSKQTADSRTFAACQC
jgi:3-oxoacyl-[acyl-carrier-protein] synthase III